MSPKQIYNHYQDGILIPNKDLITGIIFYKDLSDNLIKCGPVFSLAFREANQVYLTLRSYADSRKLLIPDGY